MPDDVVVDGRPSLFKLGQQLERVRCMDILQRVLRERPPSAPEALLRVGELIDAGS